MNVWWLFSVTLTQIFFLHIIVNFNKLRCKILSVPHFNALQHFIHTESWIFKRSIISQPYYVSFTDNLSVPQTMDYSVNQGFAKLVSSTDNSSSDKHLSDIDRYHQLQNVNIGFWSRNTLFTFCSLLHTLYRGTGSVD